MLLNLQNINLMHPLDHFYSGQNGRNDWWAEWKVNKDGTVTDQQMSLLATR